MLSNEMMRSIMNEVYNKWFTKYRDADLTNVDTWNNILSEAKHIQMQYNTPFTEGLIMLLMDELQSREIAQTNLRMNRL